MRIYIVEDQTVLREALGKLLELEPDIEVIGMSGDGETALADIARIHPDIALVDIELGDITGLDVSKFIIQSNIDCKVVLLTTYARKGYFSKAIELGVHGYLLKDTPVEEIIQKLRKVMQGVMVLSPELAMIDSPSMSLTSREEEVLRLLADGFDTKEIANRLNLSMRTVRNYIHIMMEKMQVKNRLEAVNMAREKGWV